MRILVVMVKRPWKLLLLRLLAMCLDIRKAIEQNRTDRVDDDWGVSSTPDLYGGDGMYVCICVYVCMFVDVCVYCISMYDSHAYMMIICACACYVYCMVM